MHPVSPAIHPRFVFLPLLVFARHSGAARISVVAVACSCYHPERSEGPRICLVPCLFWPLLVFARHSGAARISVVCRCQFLPLPVLACHPERRRSRPYRERRSRRTCGSYRPTTSARTFLPQNPSPRVTPIEFSLRRICTHHEDAHPDNFPPTASQFLPCTRRAPRNSPRRNACSRPNSSANKIRSPARTSTAGLRGCLHPAYRSECTGAGYSSSAPTVSSQPAHNALREPRISHLHGLWGRLA